DPTSEVVIVWTCYSVGKQGTYLRKDSKHQAPGTSASPKAGFLRARVVLEHGRIESMRHELFSCYLHEAAMLNDRRILVQRQAESSGSSQGTWRANSSAVRAAGSRRRYSIFSTSFLARRVVGSSRRRLKSSIERK